MSTEMTTTLDKLSRFYEELKKPFVGRDEEAKALTLALISREHLILLGEPGTAKTALVMRAASLLKAKYFQYLLTKYTEPSELFGPLDIVALRKGIYRRITKNRLPDADIVFLDEIFKANSAILNSLLSILNERIFYDYNGPVKLKLWCLIGASNEVPEETELQGFYDRFVIRHLVKPVNETLWEDLLKAGWEIERKTAISHESVLSLEELSKIHEKIWIVKYDHVLKHLLRLFSIFEDQGLHLTDRRKVKALKIIVAHALLNGRNVVTKEDLMALKYVVPYSLDDFEKVETIIYEELKLKEAFIRILSEARENIKYLKRNISEIRSAEELQNILFGLRRTENKLGEIALATTDYNVQKEIDELSQMINELKETISKKLEGAL